MTQILGENYYRFHAILTGMFYLFLCLELNFKVVFNFHGNLVSLRVTGGLLVSFFFCS